MRITGISSMATRSLLSDVSQAFTARSDIAVQFTSMGGVDAAQKLQAGACFDLVVLAREAIADLSASGHIIAGSAADWVQSRVAIAIHEGAPHLLIDNEASLREALLRQRVAYSTGPSGNALLQILARWEVLEPMRKQLVRAPAGVSVARLVAEGQADIGIQQLSELRNVPGVRVLGLMPPGCEIVSTFTAALGAAAAPQAGARDFLAFLHSAQAVEIIHRHGMSPAPNPTRPELS